MPGERVYGRPHGASASPRDSVRKPVDDAYAREPGLYGIGSRGQDIHVKHRVGLFSDFSPVVIIKQSGVLVWRCRVVIRLAQEKVSKGELIENLDIEASGAHHALNERTTAVDVPYPSGERFLAPGIDLGPVRRHRTAERMKQERSETDSANRYRFTQGRTQGANTAGRVSRSD